MPDFQHQQHLYGDFGSSLRIGTDSLGCNLKAIKKVMDEDALNLEIIVNNKVSLFRIEDDTCSLVQVTDKGQAVIQLETGK